MKDQSGILITLRPGLEENEYPAPEPLPPPEHEPFSPIRLPIVPTPLPPDHTKVPQLVNTYQPPPLPKEKVKKWANRFRRRSQRLI